MNPDVTADFLQPPQRVRWKHAFYTGLIAGALFFVFSKGSPWSSGDLEPTIIGRDVQPGPLVTGVLHFVFSVGYALLIAPVINRLRAAPSVMIGGLLGTLLYSINFLLFGRLTLQSPEASETIPVLTHIAFGMVVAAVYKGIGSRSAVSERQASPIGPEP